MIDSKTTYKGEWFLPGDESNKVVGVLTCCAISGIKLDLIGVFDFMNVRSCEFILGITTNGLKVTLMKAHVSQRTWEYINTVSYTATYALIGEHYQNKNDLIFSEVRARFKNLNEWIGEYGFNSIKQNWQDRAVQVDYKLPHPICFSITDQLQGKFNFTFSTPTFSTIHKAIIEQKSEVVFESSEGADFYELLSIATHFQYFLSLGTFEAEYPLSITVLDQRMSSSEDSGDPYIKVFFMVGSGYDVVGTKIIWQFLYNYKDIQQDFTCIMQQWFAQKDLLQPIIGLVMDRFYNGKRFTENSFLNVVQGLETFHRRFRKNEVNSREEYKARINKIIKSVDEDLQQWLKEKLAFTNEPVLHDRLNELFNEVSNQTLQKILMNKEELIKTAKWSRNYYTHYDNSLKNKAIKGNELFILTERLRVLLIVVILQNVGFTKEKLDELLSRNEYAFFNHLISN